MMILWFVYLGTLAFARRTYYDVYGKNLILNLIAAEAGDFPYRMFEEDLTCTKENGCKKEIEFYKKNDV